MSGHGAFGDVADFRNSRDAVTIDFACEPDRDDTGTIGILPLELQLIVFVPSSLMPFLFTMNIGTYVPPLLVKNTCFVSFKHIRSSEFRCSRSDSGCRFSLP